MNVYHREGGGGGGGREGEREGGREGGRKRERESEGERVRERERERERDQSNVAVHHHLEFMMRLVTSAPHSFSFPARASGHSSICLPPASRNCQIVSFQT
jgi:hypothetical protein